MANFLPSPCHAHPRHGRACRRQTRIGGENVPKQKIDLAQLESEEQALIDDQIVIQARPPLHYSRNRAAEGWCRRTIAWRHDEYLHIVVGEGESEKHSQQRSTLHYIQR